MRRDNNKGFSYVEMLMVLAVMAIMIGMVTISIGTIRRNTINRTSEKMEALVNKARTNALTKGSNKGWLNFTESGGGVYVYVGEKIPDDKPQWIREKGEKICSSEYEVLISFGGGTASSSDKQVHRIAFIQSTGGVIGNVGGSVFVRKKSDTTKQSAFHVYGNTGKIYR